jgi:mxaK protein
MKRAHGHLVFALVAATLGTMAIGATVRLEHAERINAEVAQWSAQIAPLTPKWIAGAADNLSPEGRLARAVALSKYDYDAALAAYKAIIQSNREDLRRIALYDLGDLHLHQAIKAGVADESQSLPLTELAKQSYRDLLRRDPTDWDARYNLERSLRLAPEDADDEEADTGPPDPHEHERSTIADPRMDLP